MRRLVAALVGSGCRRTYYFKFCLRDEYKSADKAAHSKDAG